MPTDTPPIESQWYRHHDKGYRFQVVAVDDDVIQMQHFDGDLEEIDTDNWRELDVEAIEPPEDWTGPLDDVETDDLGYTETDMSPDDWNEPLDEGPPASPEEEE